MTGGWRGIRRRLIGDEVEGGFGAAWSPWSDSATVLLNASLRETVKFGPLSGAPVVDGSTMAEGGVIGEVGDLHHRPVVDREQQPVAGGVHLCEVAQHHRGAVAGDDGHLVVRVGWSRHRRERRPGIAVEDVGALDVLQGVVVGRQAVTPL